MTTTTTPFAGTAVSSTDPHLRNVPIATLGVAVSVLAAVAVSGYGAVAIAIHGSMQAGDPGASHPAAIKASSFGIGVLMSMVLGLAIVLLVARYAAAPARRFTQIALPLLAVSLFFPLAASHTDEATRLTLAGAHLIAAAIIIPGLQRRLSRIGRSR
jgi:Family of unknown function (DUF6069)